ncbi:DNA mismatch repair protein [Bacillus sp. MUM 13]|uniref:endonuclease MutS2 n=1 Tax=Bacillus sp. MUM 13 TaxID=1678001 RepID=UPI0008F5E5A5|nr:DNA mismatch repair protein [Bacillus sp. MUM 13]OIK14740.1 DNA mismatch repair protein [Bacillus sp. MUM 13]
MNEQTLKILGYDSIKGIISEYALTDSGKQKILATEPISEVKRIRALLGELDEATVIINKSASVPLSGLDGMEQILKLLKGGNILRPEQFAKLLLFLESCSKMKAFMRDKEYMAPIVSSYVYSLEDLSDLAGEIYRFIRNGMVADTASKELGRVRKQITISKERLKEKLQNMLKSSKYKNMLQDYTVSERNGRYVLSVKKEYKGKIRGAILDISASGSTLFIEPEEAAALQDAITLLRVQEGVEEEKVLAMLTETVLGNEAKIILATEIMIHYDVLFAKAKYSVSINGRSAEINHSHRIKLVEARHPLLGDKAVPLNLEMGGGKHALVITGPNTGGKTVSIKTVGLLTAMAQSGFHISVREGSIIAVYDKILADIGDGQSLEQNLSTFSSHIVNIISILEETNDSTLVLLDELGSGTDPAEGMGLAAVILEQLYKKGASLLATTHYNEIKQFAEEHEGFINGSMEFDLKSLKPTYKLLIGKGGESQAFAIALKLGMHPELISKAHRITYQEDKDYKGLSDSPARSLDKQLAGRHADRLKKGKEPRITESIQFEMGDNVKISPQGEIGIVEKGPDIRGNFSVLVKGEKHSINHKRLKLYIPAQELYPENYDFSIVFDSKENRKMSKLMEKSHMEGASIELED